MVGFISNIAPLLNYLRGRSPGPPFPPDSRQAGERRAITLKKEILEEAFLWGQASSTPPHRPSRRCSRSLPRRKTSTTVGTTQSSAGRTTAALRPLSRIHACGARTSAWGYKTQRN